MPCQTVSEAVGRGHALPENKKGGPEGPPFLTNELTAA
jgi:hypothetical protein